MEHNEWHNGHSRTSKIINYGDERKTCTVCDILLVISSNFGHILNCFRDTATSKLKIATFLDSLSNFSMNFIWQKVEPWGYLSGLHDSSMHPIQYER